MKLHTMLKDMQWLRLGVTALGVAIISTTVSLAVGLSGPNTCSSKAHAQASCPVGSSAVFSGTLGIQDGQTKTITIDVTGSGPTDDRTYSLPDVASDTFTLVDATQTLSNKTIGASQIAPGTFQAGTYSFSGSTVTNLGIAASDITAGTFTAGTYSFASSTISDLGAVTTADINGGTWQGAIDGASTASAKVVFADNTKLIAGTGEDSSLYYDAANLIINPIEVDPGSDDGKLRIAGDMHINDANSLTLGNQFAITKSTTDPIYIRHDAGNIGTGTRHMILSLVTQSSTETNTSGVLRGIRAANVIGGSGDAVTSTANWTAPVGVLSFYAQPAETRPGSSGAITGAAGLYVANSAVSGATITNQYGVYVANLAAGTNDYGVYVAGADTAAIFVEDGLVDIDGGSVVVGNPTGGDKGDGTINAQNGVYDNGSILTDYVSDAYRGRLNAQRLTELDESVPNVTRPGRRVAFGPAIDHDNDPTTPDRRRTRWVPGGELVRDHDPAREFVLRGNWVFNPIALGSWFLNQGHLPQLLSEEEWNAGERLSTGQSVQRLTELIEILVLQNRDQQLRINQLCEKVGGCDGRAVKATQRADRRAANE